MSAPFHETRPGRRLIDLQVPLLLEALQQIAEQLKALNEELRRQREGSDGQAS